MQHMLPSQPNQSLIDGIDILESVLGSNHEVGGRELARELNLNRTRVNRLLMTLAHKGLLHRTDTGKYLPGPGIHIMAALSQQGSGLLAATMPHARNWWSRGFSFTLGILWQGRLCHVLHARPELPFESNIGGHGLIPIHESTTGLALAMQNTQLKASLIQLPLPANVAVKNLTQVFKAAQKQGYVQLPFHDGTVSIGIALGNPALAGIAVSQKQLQNQAIPEIVEQLRQTQANILNALDHASS
jgi:DNA-binding IclR family transcriptional regulator